MKHEDFCTNLKNQEDRDILTRRLFDVNMRLFHCNERYRNVVLACCDFIHFGCKYEKDGYKKPHGYSGANAGIPFNIIAYRQGGEIIVCINPKITRYYGELIESLSNCGSLVLPEHIKISRPALIDFEYYNTKGELVKMEGVDRNAGGLTIQHEIDHNLGILITDRQ